jgi:L-seryl-tRNA(Ser) seleniumtransferase
MLKNPLYRALRPDKLSLAALDATLVEHQLGRAHERLPLLRMLAATPEELRARAEAFARTLRQAAPALAATLVASESRVGGGAAPDLGLATVAIALDAGARGPDDLARALRMGAPPVVARVAEGRVLLDLRTIQPDEEAALAAAVVAAAG